MQLAVCNGPILCILTMTTAISCRTTSLPIADAPQTPMASSAFASIPEYASAVQLLTKAAQLDLAKRYAEATICYVEGSDFLLKAIRSIDNTEQKDSLRKRVNTYLDRAQELKSVMKREQATGKYSEVIPIALDAKGFSYRTLFRPYLDDSIRQCQIDDPYIHKHWQVANMTRFAELLVANCPRLQSIALVTTKWEDGADQQKNQLNELKQSLASRSIALSFDFSKSLHDREIRFDNGWVVKIGRGLDYFKPESAIGGRFGIGAFNRDFRPCLETTVNVFHRKHSIMRASDNINSVEVEDSCSEEAMDVD